MSFDTPPSVTISQPVTTAPLPDTTKHSENSGLWVEFLVPEWVSVEWEPDWTAPVCSKYTSRLEMVSPTTSTITTIISKQLSLRDLIMPFKPVLVV